MYVYQRKKTIESSHLQPVLGHPPRASKARGDPLASAPLRGDFDHGVDANDMRAPDCDLPSGDKDARLGALHLSTALMLSCRNYSVMRRKVRLES